MEGVDYYFLSEPDFMARVNAGEFLEHARVHQNYYGTLRKPLVTNLESGKDVLIDVDIQGASAIRASSDPAIQKALCDVFIMPPNLEELRSRLNKRGTESADEIELRMVNAASEMELWSGYRYAIVTQSMEEDLQKFRCIVEAERNLSRRLALA